jgi:hypothetical protein
MRDPLVTRRLDNMFRLGTTIRAEITTRAPQVQYVLPRRSTPAFHLSLEEPRSPVEQESAIRQAIDVFQKQKARDDETQAWYILARALLAEGKTVAAKEAMQNAPALAAKSQNPEVRWRTAIAAAPIETKKKGPVPTAAGIPPRKELAAVIAKSRALGNRIVELDARLALAKIEMKSAQTAEGRGHLTAIEADAEARGYLFVARKAAIARG